MLGPAEEARLSTAEVILPFWTAGPGDQSGKQFSATVLVEALGC